MASIVLAAAGASIGAGFGGTILGLSGEVIGQAAGSIIGTIIDSRIVASFAPNQISEGARLESLRVTSSTEGAVIFTSAWAGPRPMRQTACQSMPLPASSTTRALDIRLRSTRPPPPTPALSCSRPGFPAGPNLA